MEIILTSVLAFVSTNVDDLFILTLFFGDRRNKPRDIYLGQYLGIITLIVVSLVGSFLGNFIDSRYIGLMGLFPIYLGLRQLLQLFKLKSEADSTQPEKQIKTGILAVATITFANGGDNIGTYIPLFTALTVFEKSIMIAAFLVMTFAWLAMAKYLTTHPLLEKTISKYGHLVTPIVLCLLGLFIMKENGSFELVEYLSW